MAPRRMTSRGIQPRIPALKPSLPELKPYAEFESYFFADDLTPSPVMTQLLDPPEMPPHPVNPLSVLSLNEAPPSPHEEPPISTEPEAPRASRKSAALDILLGARRSSSDRPPIFDDNGPVPREVPGNLHLASDEHIKHMVKTQGSVKLVKRLATDLAQAIAENTELKTRAEYGFSGLARLLKNFGVSDEAIETSFRHAAFTSQEGKSEDAFKQQLLDAANESVKHAGGPRSAFDISLESRAMPKMSANQTSQESKGHSGGKTRANVTGEGSGVVDPGVESSRDVIGRATEPVDIRRTRAATVAGVHGTEPGDRVVQGSPTVGSTEPQGVRSAHERSRSKTDASNEPSSTSSTASRFMTRWFRSKIGKSPASGSSFNASSAAEGPPHANDAALQSHQREEASGFPSLRLSQTQNSPSTTLPENEPLDAAPLPIPENRYRAPHNARRYTTSGVDDFDARALELEMDFIYEDDTQPPVLATGEMMTIASTREVDCWGFLYPPEEVEKVGGEGGPVAEESDSDSAASDSAPESTEPSRSGEGVAPRKKSLLSERLAAETRRASRAVPGPDAKGKGKMPERPDRAFKEPFKRSQGTKPAGEDAREQKWKDFIRRCNNGPEGSGVRSSDQIGIAGWGTQKNGGSRYAEFRALIYLGIPVTLRPKIWRECYRAHLEPEPGHYRRILHESSYDFTDSEVVIEQIRVDASRTFPYNVFFREGPGKERLQEVLTAYARFDQQVKYCQGMNYVAAYLILTTPSAEEAFWLLVYAIRYVLPESYFSDFSGAKADQYVLNLYVEHLLPKLHRLFLRYDVRLDELSFTWFLTMFSVVAPAMWVYRMWDIILCRHEGSCFMIELAVALLQLNQEKLLQYTSAAEMYSHLCQDLCTDISIHQLMQTSELLRQKHIRPAEVNTFRKEAIKKAEKLLKPRGEDPADDHALVLYHSREEREEEAPDAASGAEEPRQDNRAVHIPRGASSGLPDVVFNLDEDHMEELMGETSFGSLE